ncbi:MAG TPA: trypsin-like peptidase domain-containing protein [Ktedonobacterales bacterium]
MEGTSLPPHPNSAQQPQQPEQPEQPQQPQQPQQPIQAPPPLTAEPSAPTEATGPATPPSWVPGYPAYGSGYPGYEYGQGGGYQGMPPQPPYGVVESTPPRPRRRRTWLVALGALLALLVTLTVGLFAGAAIGSGSLGPATTGNRVVLGSTSAPNVTVSSSTAKLEKDIENVATSVAPSVVKITSTTARGQQSIGSGDILSADGYIVTNDHVVQGADNITVQLSNKTTYTAQLVGEAPQDDLAVVKIAATGLKPIAFADSSKVQVGEFAIAIGDPLDLGQSVTFGVVSQLNQVASEAPSGPAGTLTGLIQTSAPINPGNSGGALVNLNGQLIGIPTLAATNPESRGSNTSIGMAISSNRVQFVAKQLIEQGKVTSTGLGFIGIEAQDVTPQVAASAGLSVQSGVLVQGFVNDASGTSPGQQAGLRTGDVITAVNGTNVTDNADLARALQNQNPGSKVDLTIVRGNSHLTITVTLGERPVSTQG